MPQLTLYTRANCHLCDEAKEQLDALRAEIPFDLRLVDIDSDPDLRAQFTHDVPVLFLDDRKIAKHRLDRTRLRRQLQRTTVRR